MSETRDVALERIDDLLRARRHGAAHCDVRIQPPWEMVVCAIKDKENI
jgi:hypothetical protein